VLRRTRSAARSVARTRVESPARQMRHRPPRRRKVVRGGRDSLIDTTRQEGNRNDPRRRLHRQPRHRRAARVRAHVARHQWCVHALRHVRRAGRRCCVGARAPVPERDLHGHRGAPRRQARPRAARARAGRDRDDRTGHPAQVLERGRDEAALPGGGATGARVRVVDRDDVRARSRRQDEQEGDAERVAAGRDREPPLRRRPAPGDPPRPPEDGARPRRTPRPGARLRRDVRGHRGITATA